MEDLTPGNIPKATLASIKMVENPAKMKVLFRWVLIIFVIALVAMFLPWTQNVPADGNVVSLYPHQQFQSIYSVISGRLSQWKVREGQHVHSGDTIAIITEVKDKFFDPGLIARMESQLVSKTSKLESYQLAVESTLNQIKASIEVQKQKKQQLANKIQQYTNKVTNAEAEVETAQNNFNIASVRIQRADSLLKLGINSRSQWENKSIKFQQTQNKLLQAKNKLLMSQNDLNNSRLELQLVQNEFYGKINKLNTEVSKGNSNVYETEVQVSKLQVDLNNYKIRSGFYYIRASQNGYITKILVAGIGSIVKESQAICSIMPAQVDLAVALYVKPIDLPLIQIGEKMVLFFDGWPAFVFSGWPDLATGTFSGEVYAIDKVIDKDKGKYRVLVIPDPHKPKWPKALRVGGGARSLFLLNNVKIGYELWRQINGFPPDFYQGSKSKYKLDPDVDRKFHTK